MHSTLTSALKSFFPSKVAMAKTFVLPNSSINAFVKNVFFQRGVTIARGDPLLVQNAPTHLP